jgi:tRNA (guanine37-N1)-methyltransferase
MMKYEVLTLFPEMIVHAAGTSVIGRAQKNGLITVDPINIRDYSCNKHMRVDDYPYGGGAGMVMEPEPVYQAVAEAKRRAGADARVVYLTPQAEVLTQTKVEELAGESSLILLCGHYEGIDERVLSETVTDYISIGDYVLTGGELGALVLIDAVSRFVPGVLGNEESADFESLQDNLLEYPHYTRPEVWHGQAVPDILLSGDHKRVEEWRHEQSLLRTKERRPDLLGKSRRIRTIWYGAPETEAAAEALTQALTRSGIVENYNRKTLQKRRNSMMEGDLLILVAGPTGADDPDVAVRFRNLSADGTSAILFTVEGANGETGAETDGNRTSEYLRSRGFHIQKIPQRNLASGRDEAIREAALTIRKMLERGEFR